MSLLPLLARCGTVLATPRPLPIRAGMRIAAEAKLPTRHGEFRLVAFEGGKDGKEHVALVRGDVRRAHRVPVRVHSECLTGDAFGSERCDCRDQLEAALRALAKEEHAVLLYLRQEGRGIGLANKVRAYALQEQGLDTNEANEALGFQADERDYAVAADMLAALGVRSIRLMTNNPDKISALEFHGVRVESRIPHEIPPTEHNARYLRTKRERSGHLLRSFGA